MMLRSAPSRTTPAAFPRHRRRAAAAALLAGLLVLAAAAGASAAAQARPWRQVASPAEAGFSAAGLAAARAAAEEMGTAAAMAVYRGHVVAAWGDVRRPFPCASMRKSLLSALYGIHVEAGRIDLAATLAELGIDDREGLTEAEKRARVLDLMQTRSGVYHPAAYEPPGMAERRPPRGAHPPGEHFYYNNWDFNALGTIFEQAVGRSVFSEFEERIARPLGMEDFERTDTFSWAEPSRTRHPAYLFRLSVRDRARFGQLFLDGGRWHGRQVVPRQWVERSTAMAVRFEPGNPFGAGDGYGLMWWVYPPEEGAATRLERLGGYAARGAGGQVILVVPAADFVFAHAGDTDRDEEVEFSDVVRLAGLVLDARTEKPAAEPRLVDLAPEPLAGTRPAPPRHTARPLADEVAERLVGEYAFGPGAKLVLHRHQGRLFANPVGVPFPETELFAASDTRLFNDEAHLVVEIEWADDGAVARLLVRRPDRQWTLERLGGLVTGAAAARVAPMDACPSTLKIGSHAPGFQGKLDR